MLIFRCLHLGELLCPLTGAGLSGSCLPHSAQGGTTTVVVASFGALDSAPAVTREPSLCRGLNAPWAGPLIWSAWGRSVLAVLGPPGHCLSWGRSDPELCPGLPCAPGPELLDSCSWMGCHLSMELLPESLRAAPRSSHVHAAAL